jgi:hypothetical protein
MRNNTLIALMVGLLFLCSMGTLFYTYKINSLTKQLKNLNNQLNGAANMRNLVNATFNAAADFSKTHSDLVPVLQSLTNNAVPAQAPTPAPANTKPPGK